MRDILRLTAFAITVAVEDMPSFKVMEFAKYHGYPTATLDNLFDYANWCSQRGYKTYVYAERGRPLMLRLLFNIMFWLGTRRGDFSEKLIRGCP